MALPPQAPDSLLTGLGVISLLALGTSSIIAKRSGNLSVFFLTCSALISLLTLIFLHTLFAIRYPFTRCLLMFAPLIFLAVLYTSFKVFRYSLIPLTLMTIALCIHSASFANIRVPYQGKIFEGGVPEALRIIERIEDGSRPIQLKYYTRLRSVVDFELMRKPLPWLVITSDESDADYWLAYPKKEYIRSYPGEALPLREGNLLMLLKRTDNQASQSNTGKMD